MLYFDVSVKWTITEITVFMTHGNCGSGQCFGVYKVVVPACAARFLIFRSSCVAYTGFRPPFRFCTGAVCSGTVASGEEAGDADAERGEEALTAAIAMCWESAKWDSCGLDGLLRSSTWG